MVETLPKHVDWPQAKASPPPKLKMLLEVRRPSCSSSGCLSGCAAYTPAAPHCLSLMQSVPRVIKEMEHVGLNLNSKPIRQQPAHSRSRPPGVVRLDSSNLTQISWGPGAEGMATGACSPALH